MSDISYSGGSSQGGGFSISGGGSDSGFFGNGMPSNGGSFTSSYGSETQNFSQTVKDVISNSNKDLGSLTNPYKKIVQTGTKYIDVYTPINDGHGGVTMIYQGQVSQPIYGDNPAYYEFENTVTQAQNLVYEDVFEQTSEHYDKVVDDFQSSFLDKYSKNYLGDTSSIQSISNAISDIAKEIYSYQLEDSLTGSFNRISDTDNSSKISALQEQMKQFQNQINQLTSDYDSRYTIARKKQDEASASNWNITGGWVQEKPYDANLNYIDTGYRQDTNGFASSLLSGEMNSWMAGGNLYDAPRAGDVTFNIMGNMNTVRFLGIEDTNNIPDMVTEFVNPELFRSLGNMAGDDNFSVIPPTTYS